MCYVITFHWILKETFKGHILPTLKIEEHGYFGIWICNRKMHIYFLRILGCSREVKRLLGPPNYFRKKKLYIKNILNAKSRIENPFVESIESGKGQSHAQFPRHIHISRLWFVVSIRRRLSEWFDANTNTLTHIHCRTELVCALDYNFYE